MNLLGNNDGGIEREWKAFRVEYPLSCCKRFVVFGAVSNHQFLTENIYYVLVIVLVSSGG